MPQPRTLTRAQVRELDRRAIEESGVPSLLLMENAARACADETERVLRLQGVRRELTRLNQPGSRDDIPRNIEELKRWKQSLGRAGTPVVVFCGPGNNGGDGLALARTLFNRGHDVRVYSVNRPGAAAPSGDVALQSRLLAGVGVATTAVTSAAEAMALAPLLAECPLVVDALFGTGLTRPVEDPWRAVIQVANEARTVRLAVDIPSGLDADTGDVLGLCFRADVTVTFVAPKPGFYVGAGPAFCGRVQVAEIGIPRPLLEQALEGGAAK